MKIPTQIAKCYEYWERIATILNSHVILMDDFEKCVLADCRVIDAETAEVLLEMHERIFNYENMERTAGMSVENVVGGTCDGHTNSPRTSE